MYDKNIKLNNILKSIKCSKLFDLAAFFSNINLFNKTISGVKTLVLTLNEKTLK